MVSSQYSHLGSLHTLLTLHRNKQKPVDLSRPFRQTGLTSGAKLELVFVSRTATAMPVALSIPETQAAGIPGGRLVDKFSTDTTIWKILRRFEETEGKNLNFTARGVAQTDSGEAGAGRIYYEMPIVHAESRELSTFGDLQKSLGQLGFRGGNCLLKLSFRKTEQPLEEAMKEIGTYFKEDAPNDEAAASSSSGAIREEIEPAEEEASSLPVEEEDVEMTSEPASAPTAEDTEPPKAVSIGQRPVSVFLPPSASMPRAALQPHNENDYEPSVRHAQLHQSRLLNNSQNKRLPSDAETEVMEKEKAAKLAAATQVTIKVRFPDQSTILATFQAHETGADLYKHVKDAIVAENAPFKLVYTDKGTHTVPNSEKRLLIKHLGLAGSVLVTFHWEDNADDVMRKQPLLKSQLLESAQEVKVPEFAEAESKEEDTGSSIAAEDKGKGKETSGGGLKKGGVPKWFLGGKKK